MRKLETLKHLFNNLLTVYSGTSQNTSPIQKIFLLGEDATEGLTENTAENPTVVTTKDKPQENSYDLITDESRDNLENTLKDKLTLNIEDVNITLTRNASAQDTSEVSIILPKTEIKKTFYDNDKITSTTEIVLSNLTILHNPRSESQIVSTKDNDEEASQVRPKLAIGFNTAEMEKASP